ncbi:unnamed protein product [Auanema sp. JU1783]|nr:unnamed protein product [Auanema sp. JU1783]
MTSYSSCLSILLFTTALVNALVYANKTNIYVCEGDEAFLQCPPGQVIKIELANFGRFSLKVCIDPSAVEDYLDDTICRNPRTLGIMQKKCDGFRDCKFSVNRYMFPDPCPEVSKYLEMTYSCVEETTTTSTTTTTAAPTTTTSQEEQQHDVIIENKPSRLDETKPILVCSARTINGVEYPATPAGLTTNVRPCMDGATGESWWKCTDEGFWLGRYPNTTKCISDWIFTKSQLLDEYIKKADGWGVADFLRDLANLARGTIQAGDLPPLLDFIEKTINVLTNEHWTLQVRQQCNDKVFELVYHLSAHADAWTAWSSHKKRKMADKLITYMEQVIAWSSGGDKPMTSIYARGHLIAQISDFYENLKKTHSVYVSLPSSKTFDYIDDSIDVPIKAFKGTDERSVVYFSATDSMGSNFEPEPTRRTSRDRPEGILIQRKIVSNIVTASIVSKGKVQKITNMQEPIFITFGHSADIVRRLTNPKCSWWDSEGLEWQSSGCDLMSHNLTHTICSCTHMTHFAVLMDIHGHKLSDFNNQLLTFLTYFGCSLSIICLAFTFICFTVFSKCGSDRVFIHKNLCAMLFIAELVFLLGIWRTENRMQCSIIAGALLYFFLSASTWMFLEGYQLYRMLVDVFPTPSKKWLFALIGYGFPAVVTAVAVLYDYTSFGTPEFCWLRTDNFFIFAFVGPAVVIFALNTLFLVMTLCIVCRHSSGGYLPCRHDSDTGRNVRTWVKGALGISCLLGVTWTFGLLWVDSDRSIIMAYAFTITNSLQGLFIFLFHVVFSEVMRKDIRRWFARHGCCGTSDSSDRKNNLQRGALSPSNGSGSGSEFLYPSSEKYHSTPRRLDSSTPYGHQALMQQYQQQLLGHQGTYDYATIQYGDMAPAQMYHHHQSPPNYRTQQRMDYRIYGGTMHRDQLYGYNTTSVLSSQPGQYHRPPPEFSPPPPPPQGVPRALYYASRRPPSSKMSDDSAYSEGGSSMLATEVTPTGATVLRMDLSKNPPVYCQDL